MLGNLAISCCGTTWSREFLVAHITENRMNLKQINIPFGSKVFCNLKIQLAIHFLWDI